MSRVFVSIVITMAVLVSQGGASFAGPKHSLATAKPTATGQPTAVNYVGTYFTPQTFPKSFGTKDAWTQYDLASTYHPSAFYFGNDTDFELQLVEGSTPFYKANYAVVESFNRITYSSNSNVQAEDVAFDFTQAYWQAQASTWVCGSSSSSYGVINSDGTFGDDQCLVEQNTIGTDTDPMAPDVPPSTTSAYPTQEWESIRQYFVGETAVGALRQIPLTVFLLDHYEGKCVRTAM